MGQNTDSLLKITIGENILDLVVNLCTWVVTNNLLLEVELNIYISKASRIMSMLSK